MRDFLSGGSFAAVLFDRFLRQYITGFSSTFGAAVLTETEKFFLTDNRYLESAQKNVKNAGVMLYSDDALISLLKQKGVSRVGIVPAQTKASEYLTLERAGFEITDITGQIGRLTAEKSQKALKSIKKACLIAQRALRESLPLLRQGITEKEFAKALEQSMISGGAQGVCFDTIVAFGKNSSVPHHQTGNTKLKIGTCVLIDFGCRYNGWCSDMTRTLFFGTPDKAYLSAYLSVLNAHESAARFIKAGTDAKAADAIAREALARDNLDKYFTHSLGHGLGLDIHEKPYLNKTSGALLSEGTVFTIEPGVYFKGRFGIRTENTYVIQGGRAKSLMSFTKAPLYIENGAVKLKKNLPRVN